MKIVEKRLGEIRPYENNPRRNDEAVQYVAESIRQFGWKQPIVIDRDGVIIAGHTRYKAAQSLGIEKVPCLIADDLTPEQVKAYRLADNKVGEIADWDFDALKEELDALDLDMTGFGFDDAEKELGGDRAGPATAESSFNYKEQYAVTVMCADEAEQQKIYERLTAEGYDCRVVCV